MLQQTAEETALKVNSSLQLDSLINSENVHGLGIHTRAGNPYV
jgi:hypothetical protein